MMDTSNKSISPETVVQQQLDAYNAHDLDALMTTYADDARLFEHPATLLASGAAQLRERFALRFQESNLCAHLSKRIVMGRFVVDHERVARTFPEGTGTIELIATYEVLDGKIINAWFLTGPKTLDVTSLRITFSDVTASDFDELAALRIAAMRASLEQVGRFDPERARERLRKSFHPEHTQFILVDELRVGFYTFRHTDDSFHLDHFYIHPVWQSRGIGSSVMRRLLAQSDAHQMPIRLGALRGSASNRFYQHHGFTKTTEDEWDIYYVRMPATHEPYASASRPG